MGRFSISTEELLSLQDDDSGDHEITTALEGDRDSDELEAPHPLGFHVSASYGITRFSLEPPGQSHLELRRRYGWLNEGDQDWLLLPTLTSTTTMMEQQYPPISHHVKQATAPITSILRYNNQFHNRPQKELFVKHDISEWFSKLALTNTFTTNNNDAIVAATSRSARHMQQVSLKAAHDRELIAKKLQQELQKNDATHKQAAEALRALMKQDHRDAKEFFSKERDEQKRVNDERQAKEKEDMEEQARLEAKEQARLANEQAQKELLRQQLEQQELERQAEAKKMDYLRHAKSLVTKLVQLREFIHPFETSKAVSKRRVQMKKVAGKISQLSADPAKVKAVASDYLQAIHASKAEDEQMKNNPQATTEMSRGTKYLIDLLAASAVVRVQAEGFNVVRGFGFPLAHMLALVGHEAKELVPVFSAHIYTVCPIAIPALPKPAQGDDEEELMEALGMTRNKAGEFETFERFIARTEGIISIVANIMASQPPEHTMFGGQRGAIEWLQRFMELLPKAPATLPLITAPVLDAFLFGAGHMMAHVFPDEFRPLLELITQDLLTRLDKGPIGAPGALRFKKLVEEGFSGFHKNLPAGALESLYYSGGPGLLSSESSSFAPGARNDFGRIASPFGTIPQENTGSVSGSRSQPADPFGGTQSKNTIFAAAGPIPFGTPSVQTDSPFGNAPGHTTSPFGMPSAPAASPFGNVPSQTQTSGFALAPGPSGPFSRAPLTSSPFGLANPTSAPAPSPLGGAQSLMPNPFSGTASLGGAPSPFGGASHGNSANGMGAMGISSPFTATASPFGSNPFNAQSQPSPPPTNYGNNRGNESGPRGDKQKAPCRFFAQGNCRNGENCPFSHETPRGSNGAFGQQDNAGNSSFSGQQQQPFGSKSNSSPFGQQQAQTVTPFVGSSSNNPFGQPQRSGAFGASSTNTPFGQQTQQSNDRANQSPFGGRADDSFSGRNNKKAAPCRFFAQGTCRNGDNCPFSHENQGSGVNSGGNNPFGGPRR